MTNQAHINSSLYGNGKVFKIGEIIRAPNKPKESASAIVARHRTPNIVYNKGLRTGYRGKALPDSTDNQWVLELIEGEETTGEEVVDAGVD
ncbi:hypothetical protein LTR84_012889 [Exophiala bonariae]|uniref:Hypervirulence associated protein TUDOR domain-containing protein n=1 Tax=Exophiala bonariae TaxID=1690606 RepID=A0AAV9NGR6_9EURO|nr:hypothetical protein LTR84_012889 [Exophiala bonariae]